MADKWGGGTEAHLGHGKQRGHGSRRRRRHAGARVGGCSRRGAVSVRERCARVRGRLSTPCGGQSGGSWVRSVRQAERGVGGEGGEGGESGGWPGGRRRRGSGLTSAGEAVGGRESCRSAACCVAEQRLPSASCCSRLRLCAATAALASANILACRRDRRTPSVRSRSLPCTHPAPSLPCRHARGATRCASHPLSVPHLVCRGLVLPVLVRPLDLRPSLRAPPVLLRPPRCDLALPALWERLRAGASRQGGDQVGTCMRCCARAHSEWARGRHCACVVRRRRAPALACVCVAQTAIIVAVASHLWPSEHDQGNCRRHRAGGGGMSGAGRLARGRSTRGVGSRSHVWPDGGTGVATRCAE